MFINRGYFCQWQIFFAFIADFLIDYATEDFSFEKFTNSPI